MTTTSVRWRTDTGTVTALVTRRGRKWLHLVAMPVDGRGVRMRRVRVEEEKYMVPLLDSTGKPYDIRNHAARLLGAGATFGITNSTRETLQAISEES